MRSFGRCGRRYVDRLLDSGELGIRFNVSGPRSEWKTHYVGNLRENFTWGVWRARVGKKARPKLYLYICFTCIPYACCPKFRTGSSCIAIQTAVEAREGPRLDHERFRPSQPQCPVKEKCSVLLQSSSITRGENPGSTYKPVTPSERGPHRSSTDYQ